MPHLMVMVVQVGAARRTLESGRPGALRALEVVERTGSETLAEVHSLLELVDPDVHRPGPAYGMAYLAPLLDRVRASGMAVDLVVDGEPRPMSEGADLVAHRIVQESLTNVIRHAGARRVQVHVTWLPDRLSVDVVDDGQGLTAGVSSGLGLAGMRERAELYGGSCSVVNAPGGGAVVSLMLPLLSVEASA
jgi:signal transduction histidine kinase